MTMNDEIAARVFAGLIKRRDELEQFAGDALMLLREAENRYGNEYGSEFDREFHKLIKPVIERGKTLLEGGEDG